MTYTITKNEHYNSLEISFDGKPCEAIRDALKALKFRWNGVRRVWYGYTDEETARAALAGANGSTEAQTPAEDQSDKPSQAIKEKPVKTETENGVKVGDMFYTSWGYEQTNVDFFQVIAIKGKTSVLVRQVRPQQAEDDPVSGMSSDRRYKLPAPGELLPPSSYSSFIRDNEHGDLKRVTLGWNDEPRIKVGRAGGYQTTATPYHGQKVYESWYN